MGSTFTMGLANQKAEKKMIPSADPAFNSEPEDLGNTLGGATKKKAIVSSSKQLPMLNKFTKS